jgi:hypothetical protein
MRNAMGEKYSSLTRGRFLIEQLLAMNPITFLLSLPGLVWGVTHRADDRRRLVGIVFFAVFAILLANPHTKSEYMAAVYPMAFACGGVTVAGMRRPWGPVVTRALAVLLFVSGAALASLAMPLLPVDKYLGYSKALGVAPSTAEAKELADLPQFFADMHGWDELARDVSQVYLTIPEPERATTVAFVTNYGEAGALELFAHRYPLPRVICNHNSYWFWGTGQSAITTYIRLGGEREDYFESYGEVTPAGVHRCSHCMPYENNLNIFVTRNRYVPIERAWKEYKHFE